MGEPTFKAFSMRQRFLKHMLESVGRYVIRQKLLAERGEPDWWDERLACVAVFPEMTARDTTKYAAALAQVVAAVNLAIAAHNMTAETGVALIAAVAGRLGVEIDPVAELEAAQKAKTVRDEADSFTGPNPIPELEEGDQ